MSTSIAHGKARGLQTVAGTSLAMLIQLSVTAVGTAWFVSVLATGFFWLKWLGVAYLLYLGLSHLWAMRHAVVPASSAEGSFQRGFWVSLTNPKTLLFFSAFLPQFVLDGQPYYAQIITLSLIFLSLAVVLDSAYVLLADKLLARLKAKGSGKWQNGFSGILYLGAGSMLALTAK